MAQIHTGIDFRYKTIIVVDDSLLFRRLMESLLRSIGVGSIVLAKTVDQAMTAIGKRQVDCLIADWMMDSANGLDLARRIRSSPKSPNPALPIVLCTAYTERERVIEARDAGVTEFLAKPISAAHLYDKLASALFAERTFIQHKGYVGPDRRRQTRPYNGPERRRDLNQEAIDVIMIDGGA